MVTPSSLIAELRELGGITANWASVNESRARRTIRRAADALSTALERAGKAEEECVSLTGMAAGHAAVIDSLEERVKVLEAAMREIAEGEPNGKWSQDIARRALSEGRTG